VVIVMPMKVRIQARFLVAVRMVVFCLASGICCRCRFSFSIVGSLVLLARSRGAYVVELCDGSIALTSLGRALFVSMISMVVLLGSRRVVFTALRPSANRLVF